MKSILFWRWHVNVSIKRDIYSLINMWYLKEGHVLWNIHSIGKWETCSKCCYPVLFLVLQPKTITSINVRTQDMSTPAKKLPWHNMFNAFFGLKTDFNQKKRKSRNYHWSLPCTLPTDKVSKKWHDPLYIMFYLMIAFRFYYTYNKCSHELIYAYGHIHLHTVGRMDKKICGFSELMIYTFRFYSMAEAAGIVDHVATNWTKTQPKQQQQHHQ